MTRRTIARPSGAALLLLVLCLAGCGRAGVPTAVPGGASVPAATAGAPSVDGGSAEAPPVPDDGRLFAADSPWNTAVDELPVHPGSARMMALADVRLTRTDGGGVDRTESTTALGIATRGWTGPVAAGGEPTVLHCRAVRCGEGSSDLTVEVPTDLSPDPALGGWFTVVDARTGRAYDLWRARRESDGLITFASLRAWDVGGPGFGAPYVAGARGSGLPLAAGMIRPDELESGVVDHALAIALPGAAAGWFVPPASSTDGVGPVNSVPEGARLRLSPDARYTRPVDPGTGEPLPMTARQYRYAHLLVETLRTYGAVVVGQADVPTLLAEPTAGDDPAHLLGYELQALDLDDLDVVAFGADDRIPFPDPSGAA